MKYWIYISEELKELKPLFEKVFEVDNLYFDYENVWEWIESSNKNSKYYLNIARTHVDLKGEYNKPIMILVKSNAKEELDEQGIAFRIKHVLKCDVYAGDICADDNDNPIIGRHRKY